MGGRSSKLTLQERFQLVKRHLNRSIREIDRERGRLEQEQKQLKVSIRKAAETGDMTTVKCQAKDLVKLRAHSTKFMQMKSNLQSVQLKLQTVKSTHAMSQSLETIPKLMLQMNKELNAPKLQSIMKQFMVESEKLGLTQDFMEDIIDGVTDTSMNDVEKEDQIVSQVLEEVGIDMSSQLLAAPLTSGPTTISTGVPQAAQQNAVADNVPGNPDAAQAADALEQSLEERLRNLKS